MATVKISFGSAMGAGAPVLASKPHQVETLASDGASTIIARDGDYATLYASAPIHVDIGPAPAAGASTGYAQGEGTWTYGPLKAGDRVAVAEIT